MNIPRNEILHRVLCMVDAGWVARLYTPPTWLVRTDHRPAPDNARWALTTLSQLGLVIWWADDSGWQFATITPHGLEQLRAWDSDLLDTPIASSRPLAGLNTEQLDAEAARLIDGVFGTRNPKDQP